MKSTIVVLVCLLVAGALGGTPAPTAINATNATAVPTQAPTTSAMTTAAPTMVVPQIPSDKTLCTATRQFTRHHFILFLGGNPCTLARETLRLQELIAATSGAPARQQQYQAELASLQGLQAQWDAQTYTIESGECCWIRETAASVGLDRLYEFCWDGDDFTLNMTEPTQTQFARGTAYVPESCFIGHQCDQECFELDFAKSLGRRVSVRVSGWSFGFDFNTTASSTMSIVLLILIVGIVLLGIYFIIFGILSKKDGGF